MGRPPYLDDSFPATKTQGTKECKNPEGSPNRTRSSMRTKRARTHMARMMRLGSCSRSFSACCMGGGYRRQRRRGKEVVTGFPRAGAGGQPRGLPSTGGARGRRAKAAFGGFPGFRPHRGTGPTFRRNAERVGTLRKGLRQGWGDRPRRVRGGTTPAPLGPMPIRREMVADYLG